MKRLIRHAEGSSVRSFKQNMLWVTIAILIAVFFDTYAEFSADGWGSSAIKDVINIAIIVSGLSLYAFRRINTSLLLQITCYASLLNTISTIFFRAGEVGFNFETFFLECQVIIIVLALALGMLLELYNLIILIGVNIFFTLSCYLLGAPMDNPKYLFYIFTGTMSIYLIYRIQRTVIKQGVSLYNAHRKIQAQNKNLEELIASKDQLFKIIGHDVRTPFAQIRTCTELLEGGIDKQTSEEITKMMKQAADEGLALLSNLLNWANSQLQADESKLIPHKIKEPAQAAVKLLRPSAEAKGINLSNEVDENLEMVFNAEMIETVLRNLLGNAIKFTDKGGQILVYTAKENGTPYIGVKDSGVGMSKENILQLSSTGRVSSRPGTENETGTGLGLGICKGLVEANKGSLEISSAAGEGSLIKIFLPEVV